MNLPTLIDPTTAARLTGQEEAILQAATDKNLILRICSARALDEISESIAAISLANELCYSHESTSPADAAPYHAATQLKLWHLYRLDQLLAC